MRTTLPSSQPSRRLGTLVGSPILLARVHTDMRHRIRLLSPIMRHGAKNTSIRVRDTVLVDASKHSMRIALPTASLNGTIFRQAMSRWKNRTVVKGSRVLRSHRHHPVYGPQVAGHNNTSRQPHKVRNPLHKRERPIAMAPPFRRQRDRSSRRNAWFPASRRCPGPPRPKTSALRLSKSAQVGSTMPMLQQLLLSMFALLATRAFPQHLVSGERCMITASGFRLTIPQAPHANPRRSQDECLPLSDMPARVQISERREAPSDNT